MMVMITVDFPDQVNRFLEIERAKKGENSKRDTVVRIIKGVMRE